MSWHELDMFTRVFFIIGVFATIEHIAIAIGILDHRISKKLKKSMTRRATDSIDFSAESKAEKRRSVLKQKGDT